MNRQIRIAAIAAGLVLVVGIAWATIGFFADENGPTVMVQADASPYKSKPDEAGGMEIPHQDKMVFNAMADGKTAQVERIMPPPEQPAVGSSEQPLMAIEPVDTPGMQQPASAQVPADTAEAIAAMGRVVQPTGVATAGAPEMKAAVEGTSAFDIARPDANIRPVVTKEAAKEVIVPPAPTAKPEEKVGEAAPAAPVEKAPETPSQTVTSVSVPEPAPAQPEPKANMAMEPMASAGANVPSSGPRFQLASFTDRASAEKAVAKFSSKYGSALSGAELGVVEGTVKGKRVYRIQGGSSSPSSVCSGVKAAGGSCMVVK